MEWRSAADSSLPSPSLRSACGCEPSPAHTGRQSFLLKRPIPATGTSCVRTASAMTSTATSIRRSKRSCRSRRGGSESRLLRRGSRRRTPRRRTRRARTRQPRRRRRTRNASGGTSLDGPASFFRATLSIGPGLEQIPPSNAPALHHCTARSVRAVVFRNLSVQTSCGNNVFESDAAFSSRAARPTFSCRPHRLRRSACAYIDERPRKSTSSNLSASPSAAFCSLL